MEKCGLQYEGTLRKADWSNQGIVDACMYALLREDTMQESDSMRKGVR
jgi:ribosomal-protein-alanine N-acetyltransferase